MTAIYFQIPNIQAKGKKILHKPHNFSLDTWLQNLAKELEFKAPCFNYNRIKSIYVAGANPANLPKTFLLAILNLAKQHFSLQEFSEVSIEANPKSLDLASLSRLRDTGFNRLVVKVYSLNDQQLRNMGVSHTSKEAIEVIESIKMAGFDNYCLEMTYAHPYQSHDEWLRELSLLASYGVPHITAEAFSENYSFRQKAPKTEIENVFNLSVAKGFSAIRAFVNEHDYDHYDVVNLALKGYESLQNMAYSYREPYLGLGPGAESFHQNARWQNFSNIHQYLNCLNDNITPAQKEMLSDVDIVNEKLLLGLRSNKGIHPELELKHHLRTIAYDHLMEELEKAYANHRLIKDTSEHFFFNRNYWLEVDDWLSRFFILP